MNNGKNKIMPKDETEWKKALSNEEYKVLRENGTEAPFSGKYTDEKTEGMYKCRACGNFLFDSHAKFDSGTGWPSFDEAIKGAVKFEKDSKYEMNRTEVLCAKCGSHLGHIFDDLPAPVSGQAGGPTKSGKRYCINSVCLELEKKREEK